ncbi:MAG: hypothetical protein K9G67_12300 [Bacteroidales bacterium]|nr:hypothetical protein [Bacteroidales bacterium]MCF8377130.1 hypothetical protein [Bacteroidales bacterium]MCF8401036.1 hypothetical protein [Bacteroidales bacterium]
MNKIILITLFLFSLAFPARTQDPLRVEIKAKMENDVFNLMPCGEHGLLVFYQSIRMQDEKQRLWIFTFYDESLEPQREYEVPLAEGVFYKEYLTDSLAGYMIFHNPNNIKDDEFNLQVVKFDYLQKQFSFIRGRISEKAELADAALMKQKVYFGFNMKRYETGLFYADFNKHIFGTIDLNPPDKALVETIYPDRQNGLVRVMVNDFLSRKENQFLLYNFSEEGSLISRLSIKPEDEEIELNSVRMTNSGNKLMLIGTYNNSSGRLSDIKNEDEVISAGLYVSAVEGNRVEFIKLHNFLEFQNFTTYVNASELFRLRRKSMKNPGNPQEYSLNYRLLLHDIQKKDGEYILLAESYYPDYRTVSYITYDYYGRPFPQTYSVFEGYKYFSGIIAGFDNKGNLLWDNGIKVMGLTTFRLEKKLVGFFSGDDLVLAYNTQGKVASEIFDNGITVGDFEYINLEQKYKKDKLMKAANSGIMHWYDSYFICFGYQEIRNNALPGNSRRTVFYINKLAFE